MYLSPTQITPETVFRGDKLTLNVYLSPTQIMPETVFRGDKLTLNVYLSPTQIMPETVFRGDKLTLNVYLSATHPQIMPETAFRAEAHEPTMEKKRSSVMKVCPYAYNVKMRLKQRQCVLGYPSIDLIQKHPSSLTELLVVCLYEHFSTYLPIS